MSGICRFRTRLALVAAVAFLGFVGCVDDPLAAEPEDDAATVEWAPVDERVDYGDDPAQYGWLKMPASAGAKVPLVVLIHGGFWSEPWDYTLMAPFEDAFAAEGFATWNIEFRRLGGRGGWPATGDDVVAALDHIDAIAERLPIDRSRIALVGHSSGGHLALWAVDKSNTVTVRGAVGLAAVTDLENTVQAQAFLGGVVADVPDRFAAAAPILDPALVRLVHGGDDRIVPVEMTDNAVAAGVDRQVVAGDDHFDIITADTASFDAAIGAVIELLER